MKLIIHIIISTIIVAGIICILLAGQARADEEYSLYTEHADEEQYVCAEHGFVETENITFHGLDFPVCSICLERIIQNNSDTFARIIEEAWRGKTGNEETIEVSNDN